MTLPQSPLLDAQIIRVLTIDGKRFEITLLAAGERSWHWCITAPGELALSGDADSEIQALHLAGRAGRALARLEIGLNPQRA
jgi:hypothetical protein